MAWVEQAFRFYPTKSPMKNKGDTQDELTGDLTERAQQKAQLEELQIKRMQELSKHHR